MAAHAIYAPSSAARWLPCPASAEIAATLPNYDSDESKEGTRVHSLIENAIAGKTPQGESEDVVYAIDLMLDFVRQIGGFDSVRTEEQVHLSEDIWGTIDVFQPKPFITTIADYKNGAMDVLADRNKQMLTYAASAMEEYGPSKYYRLVIVQPNSRTAGDVPEVKQWLATLEDVEAHRELVLQAVVRGRGGEAPQPGRHCRYCPAFGNCSATREMLPMIMAAVTLSPVEVPNHVAVRVLRILRGLEDFRKGLEKDILKRFAVGQQVPDCNVGTTNTHRKWADDRLAVEELMKCYGKDGVDPVTPATAEKMGQMGKEIVGRLAFKPAGGASLKY